MEPGDHSDVRIKGDPRTGSRTPHRLILTRVVVLSMDANPPCQDKGKVPWFCE